MLTRQFAATISIVFANASVEHFQCDMLIIQGAPTLATRWLCVRTRDGNWRTTGTAHISKASRTLRPIGGSGLNRPSTRKRAAQPSRMLSLWAYLQILHRMVSQRWFQFCIITQPTCVAYPQSRALRKLSCQIYTCRIWLTTLLVMTSSRDGQHIKSFELSRHNWLIPLATL